ncbi:hypothetical protein CC78DRAFT_576325 [Lojkania enalia]|uniref:Uncharacterized protein n=1 Tax=Lojkania enalia TaxID=147567 RepID=A0A9P4KJB1_9PLEO|nr:hypothetical protein CC78DRAFT_576325 [Didymosphaeria enalia]
MRLGPGRSKPKPPLAYPTTRTRTQTTALADQCTCPLFVAIITKHSLPSGHGQIRARLSLLSRAGSIWPIDALFQKLPQPSAGRGAALFQPSFVLQGPQVNQPGTTSPSVPPKPSILGLSGIGPMRADRDPRLATVPPYHRASGQAASVYTWGPLEMGCVRWAYGCRTVCARPYSGVVQDVLCLISLGTSLKKT